MQTSRNGYFFVLDRTNWEESADHSFRSGELGPGRGQGWPSDSESAKRNPLPMGA